MNPHRPNFPETPVALILVLVVVLLGSAPRSAMAWEAEWIVLPRESGEPAPRPAVPDASPPTADETPAMEQTPETLSKEAEGQAVSISEETMAMVELLPEDPAAFPALLALLQEPERRARVAWLLGELARTSETAAQAVPPLALLLGDEDTTVRRNAAEALTSILEAVPLLDESSRWALLQVLEQGEAPARIMVADLTALLGSAGDWATPTLEAALAAEDPKVQLAAAQALGALGLSGVRARHDVVTDLIVHLLPDQEPDETVRAAVAKALGQFGPAMPGVALAQTALLQALADEYAFVRLAAAWALLRLDPYNAALILAVRNGEGDELLEAARAYTPGEDE